MALPLIQENPLRPKGHARAPHPLFRRAGGG